ALPPATQTLIGGKGHGARADPRAGAALADRAVARIAAHAHEHGLAVRRRWPRRFRRLGVHDACQRAEQCDREEETPHRGCVTTSIRYGSPFFTTASPRRIAPPRSFGSAIGPHAPPPLLCRLFPQ